MSKHLRFVSWAAVSSLPQTKKVSLDDQLQTNRQHVTQHDGQLVAELVVPGESRSIVLFEEACRRIEAYAQLKELIDSKAFDVLVYLDRSRLGRKASLSMAVVELCHEAGIITYETENPPTVIQMNGSVSHDDMLIGAIKSVGAQREIEKLKERHQKGMVGRVRKGEFPSAVPWGWTAIYEQDGSKCIVIDEAAAAIIRYALIDLYLNRNMPIRTIATELNQRGSRPPVRTTWDRHSVYNLIKLIPRYAGYVELNRISHAGRPYVRPRGAWPPILSEEEHTLLINERTSRAAARRGVRSHLFSRIGNCAYCGKRIVAHAKEAGKRKETMWYRCTDQCVGSYTRESVIFQAIEVAINYLADAINREQVLDAMPDPRLEIAREIERLDTELKHIADSRNRLTTAYIELQTLDNNEYKQRMDDYAQRAATIKRQYEHAQNRLSKSDDETARRARLEEIVQDGISILYGDMHEANGWIRRHFRFWIKENAVSKIEYI